MEIKFKQAKPPVFDQVIFNSDLRRMKAGALKTRAQAQIFAMKHGLIFDDINAKVFTRVEDKFAVVEEIIENIKGAIQVGYTRDGNRILPLFKDLNIIGTVAYLERELPEFVDDNTIETYLDEGIYFLQGSKVFFQGNVSKVITDFKNQEQIAYPYRMNVSSWGTIIK